jgi:cellobiose-specific phosphotransferase system component IIB
MDLLEWIGVGSAIAGLVGIWLGYLQLRRTANATTATQIAIENTVRQMAATQLLLLLPQLQFFGDSLERAAEDNDIRVARTALVQWFRLASELKGILSAMDHTDQELIDRLDRSVLLSARAKRSLLNEGTALPQVLGKVQPSVDDVTQHISTLAGQLRSSLIGGLDAKRKKP